MLLLSVLLSLLVARPFAAASVTASPSNNSALLAQEYGLLRWILTDSQNAFASQVDLAPLTESLATLSSEDFQSSRFTGSLINTTPANSASITTRDISLISCDSVAYSGYLDVASTITDVATLTNGGPVAVVLYSTQSDYCNFTASSLSYSNVFTVLTASSARAVLNNLNSNSTTSTSTSTSSSTSSESTAAPVVTIASNMSSTAGANAFNSSSSGSSGGGGTSTTAVAMVILYTITGIITALFLGIIISGAVRAHRNPERYGPRNVRGRPRQSRARGIARAMLETIPIVKFGDNPDDNLAAAKRDVDVELASRNEDVADPSAELDADTTGDAAAVRRTPAAPTIEHAAEHPQSETDTAATTTAATDTATATATTDTPNNKDTAETGNHVCPICTDDFVKGQDVRLLPCSHQFHPECIDPWLINVSGTCPLCRIDLNPAVASEDGQGRDDGGDNDTNHAEEIEQIVMANLDEMRGIRTAPVQAQPRANPNTSSRPVSYRGLAGYMRDIRRARNAPVEERIEALRRLRQSNMAVNADTDADADARHETEQRPGRGRRLTTRLRDRFRIRTRPHGAASDDAPSSPA